MRISDWSSDVCSSDLVEVPLGAHPVKYEMDKESGAIFVDRFLHTSMQYPLNYGFIPHTLSNDGDPVDILIANNIPVIPGAVVRVRPIGMLRSEEHTSELQSLMRISYAVFCLKKKKKIDRYE